MIILPDEDMTIIDSSGCRNFPSDSSGEFRRDVLKAIVVAKKKTYNSTVGSYLGFIWLVLDPLVLTLVYLFVFTVIAHREDPAAVFVGLGIIRGLQRSLLTSSSPTSLNAQGGFPIERVRTRVLVFSGLMVLALDSFFMGIGISGVLYLVLGKSFIGSLSFIPILFLSNLFWQSAGLLTLNVTSKIPDLHKLLSYFGMGMFFVSPVLYSFSLTSGIHRTFCYYNPATYFIELSRLSIGTGNGVNLLPIQGFLVLAAIGILMTVIGNIKLDRIRWSLSSRS